MGKIKALSGHDIITIFLKLGFNMASQKGSHVKLVRIAVQQGDRQVLIIPLHDELDKGTMKAIIRQATRYISEDILYLHFFSD